MFVEVWGQGRGKVNGKDKAKPKPKDKDKDKGLRSEDLSYIDGERDRALRRNTWRSALYAFPDGEDPGAYVCQQFCRLRSGVAVDFEIRDGGDIAELRD